MHFVKKTPATEAEKLAILKKRLEKLKLYKDVRNRIFEKRENSIFNLFFSYKSLILDEFDVELLSLTSELLKKNPDIYTFWNIRREVIDQLLKNVIYFDNNRTLIFS